MALKRALMLGGVYYGDVASDSDAKRSRGGLLLIPEEETMLLPEFFVVVDQEIFDGPPWGTVRAGGSWYGR